MPDIVDAINTPLPGGNGEGIETTNHNPAVDGAELHSKIAQTTTTEALIMTEFDQEEVVSLAQTAEMASKVAPEEFVAASVDGDTDDVIPDLVPAQSASPKTADEVDAAEDQEVTLAQIAEPSEDAPAAEETPVVIDDDSSDSHSEYLELCPYTPGNTIYLQVADTKARLKAEILQFFPATCSCVMVIRFLDPPSFNDTSECVLKLYDRRFSTELRYSEASAGPWNPEEETAYKEFIEAGHADEFFFYWDAAKERSTRFTAKYMDNFDEWSDVKREAYIQWVSTTTFEVEKKAYEQMKDLQGQDVPKLLGEIVLSSSDDAHTDDGPHKVESNEHDNEDDDDDDKARFTACPGLLLQHIKGFSLTILSQKLPREHFQSVVDSALTVLRRIQGCGILNRDVNTRSFIVNPDTHKTMMIDFGMVTFREQADNEREWDQMQNEIDEEGAIGYVMLTKLKREAGYDFLYHRSEAALRLDYRFNLEAGENEGGTKEEDEYIKVHLGNPEKVMFRI